MANYLAVDSGGTKVLAILYDEDFRPKVISRVGSFRLNTTSSELVARNMEQIKQELGLSPGAMIDMLTGIVYPEFIEFLQKNYTIKAFDPCGETSAGLCAAGIFGDGLLALSGTGSNTGAHYNGNSFFAGGYGAAVCDIGSGYWIAREAMCAAIADFEGYGEETLLSDLIAEHFGKTKPEMVAAIFSNYARPEIPPVTQVAACAPLVSKAASAGDRIAQDILIRAGQFLGWQSTALIRRQNIPDQVPITISGSVWHSHRLFFDTFADCIRTQSPDRPILIPEFEPIIGLLIRHYYKQYGKFDEQDRSFFRETYPQYLSGLHL